MKNILVKFEINNFTYILFLLALLGGFFKDLVLIFIIVIVHEIGHIIMFKLFDIEIFKCVLYPFGGFTYVENRIHEKFYIKLFCALGGIINQIILWVLFYFLFKNNFLNYELYNKFNTYNNFIILFNLLPLIPLDGSKIVLYVLSLLVSFRLSYILYILICMISLIIFSLFIFLFKLNNIVIIVFLFFNLIKCVMEFKYMMNKFYLERILYDHNYNKIIYLDNFTDFKINKYYYINYVDEKKYLSNKMNKGIN